MVSLKQKLLYTSDNIDIWKRENLLLPDGIQTLDCPIHSLIVTPTNHLHYCGPKNFATYIYIKKYNVLKSLPRPISHSITLQSLEGSIKFILCYSLQSTGDRQSKGDRTKDDSAMQEAYKEFMGNRILDCTYRIQI